MIDTNLIHILAKIIPNDMGIGPDTVDDSSHSGLTIPIYTRRREIDIHCNLFSREAFVQSTIGLIPHMGDWATKTTTWSICRVPTISDYRIKVVSDDTALLTYEYLDKDGYPSVYVYCLKLGKSSSGFQYLDVTYLGSRRK